MKLTRSQLTDRQIYLGFFLFAILLCLPSILFRNHVPRDTAQYYAPMIRELAYGNFSHAYWHMIPPLFSTIGGIFSAVFKTSPYLTAKILSSFFYAITVFPAASITRQLFDRKVSWISLALFCLSISALQAATAGGIDTMKMFFLTASVDQIIKLLRSSRPKPAILGGICCAGMALSRAEGVAMALLLLFMQFILSLRSLRKTLLTIASVTIFLIALAPWIAYEYHVTGYPVTDSRQIGSIETLPVAIKSRITKPIKHTQEAQILQKVRTLQAGDKDSVSAQIGYSFHNDVLKECINGITPLNTILLIVGTIALIRERRFNSWHLLSVSLFTAHTLILLASVGWKWTNSRYVMQAMPLILGLSATGGQELGKFLWSTTRRRSVLLALLALFCCFGIYKGNRSVFSESKRLEQQAVEACANWIKANDHLASTEAHPIKSTNLNYSNGRSPRILSDSGRVSLAAEADSIIINNYGHQLSLEQLNVICREKYIHLIILERRILRSNPELKQLKHQETQFKTMFSTGEGKYRHWVVGYLPNLQQTTCN